MAEHFTTTPEGPLGSGRLFNNPSLDTLDKLLGAQKNLPTSAGRRGAGEAFKNFSAFLDLQDRRKAARQNADLRRKSVELTLEKQKIENEAAKQKLSQREETGLTPELIQLTTLPRAKFITEFPNALRTMGKKLSSRDLVSANNANLAHERNRQSATSESRLQQGAEDRAPEEKLRRGIALVEKELKRDMTRAERIRFSDAKSRGLLLQELSEEVAAKEEAKGGDGKTSKFTQEPEQSGIATAEQIQKIAEEKGLTDPAEIVAAVKESGLRFR